MNRVAVVPMDIHKRFSRVTPMDQEGNVLGERRVAHGDQHEMERFFGEFEPGTDVVMEATFNWPWIADLAEKAGLRVHLADPMRLRARAKGLAKSDRKDAIFAGKLWLKGIFPEVYLAPPGVRYMRVLFRTRLLFVRIRTALKNSIHGIMFKAGIVMDKPSDLFSPGGRSQMSRLELDDPWQMELEQKMALLDDLERHISGLEEKINKHLKKDPRADLLMTLPGVGPLSAYAILAEAGEIKRFPNGRALAAYAGLLPLDNESGGKDFGKKTGWHSNRFLRWAALETVSGAVCASRRMKSLHSRVKARNPGMTGKARVAVAREILELAHLVLTRKVEYLEKPPPRPGSKQRRRKPKAFSGKGIEMKCGLRPNRASQKLGCARPLSAGQAES